MKARHATSRAVAETVVLSGRAAGRRTGLLSAATRVRTAVHQAPLHRTAARGRPKQRQVAPGHAQTRLLNARVPARLPNEVQCDLTRHRTEVVSSVFPTGATPIADEATIEAELLQNADTTPAETTGVETTDVEMTGVEMTIGGATIVVLVRAADAMHTATIGTEPTVDHALSFPFDRSRTTTERVDATASTSASAMAICLVRRIRVASTATWLRVPTAHASTTVTCA